MKHHWSMSVQGSGIPHLCNICWDSKSWFVLYAKPCLGFVWRGTILSVANTDVAETAIEQPGFPVEPLPTVHCNPDVWTVTIATLTMLVMTECGSHAPGFTSNITWGIRLLNWHLHHRFKTVLQRLFYLIYITKCCLCSCEWTSMTQFTPVVFLYFLVLSLIKTCIPNYQDIDYNGVLSLIILSLLW